MPRLTLRTRLRQRRDCAFQTLDGETVVLLPRGTAEGAQGRSAVRTGSSSSMSKTSEKLSCDILSRALM